MTKAATPQHAGGQHSGSSRFTHSRANHNSATAMVKPWSTRNSKGPTAPVASGPNTSVTATNPKMARSNQVSNCSRSTEVQVDELRQTNEKNSIQLFPSLSVAVCADGGYPAAG